MISVSLSALIDRDSAPFRQTGCDVLGLHVEVHNDICKALCSTHGDTYNLATHVPYDIKRWHVGRLHIKSLDISMQNIVRFESRQVRKCLPRQLLARGRKYRWQIHNQHTQTIG